MASIQAKIGWKRQRKTENKNYRFVTFLTDEFQKNSEKIRSEEHSLNSSHSLSSRMPSSA